MRRKETSQSFYATPAAYRGTFGRGHPRIDFAGVPSSCAAQHRRQISKGRSPEQCHFYSRGDKTALG